MLSFSSYLPLTLISKRLPTSKMSCEFMRTKLIYVENTHIRFIQNASKWNSIRWRQQWHFGCTFSFLSSRTLSFCTLLFIFVSLKVFIIYLFLSVSISVSIAFNVIPFWSGKHFISFTLLYDNREMANHKFQYCYCCFVGVTKFTMYIYDVCVCVVIRCFHVHSIWIWCVVCHTITNNTQINKWMTRVR